MREGQLLTAGQKTSRPVLWLEPGGRIQNCVSMFLRAEDTRPDPVGVIAGGRPGGHHAQHEFHVLAGQRAQVEIGLVRKTLVGFAEGPEGLDRPAGLPVRDRASPWA